MFATHTFITALYNDVKERLPLWRTEYVDLEGSTATAVTSTWMSPDKKKNVRVFLGVEANARPAVTPAIVRKWVQHVTRLYSVHATGELLCYLCFIDAAGSVSYYTCETAAVDA
ncbi:hypothetical protein ABL78_6866 [Leptomonas seymouri]|uniref:Uncharacterized protein n=1 Tax=Leptomonas seymouri TaxID=5684 RepID=A0A0N1I1F2_LEPSE|nr:hypothetical protein ABL78_6866 [Leptomonas seymouri]|eukprot:KPI84088.1 hypothetical protein ABL78_6866 [Leptomonas seymouri]